MFFDMGNSNLKKFFNFEHWNSLIWWWLFVGVRKAGKGSPGGKNRSISPKLARKRLLTLYWGFFRAGKRFPMELADKKFSLVPYTPKFALYRGSWHVWPLCVTACHFWGKSPSAFYRAYMDILFQKGRKIALLKCLSYGIIKEKWYFWNF